MRIIVIFLSIFFSTTSIHANMDDQHFLNQTKEELRKGIESKHPVTYYYLALKLFNEGKKTKAVEWFYIGQIRYRFHLSANKGKLDPSGDPALFSSLSHTVGTPLNEYAFEDIEELLMAIDKAMEWDEKNANAFTSKEDFKDQHKETLDGLLKLKAMVQQNAEDIRKQRELNGLDNR